MADANIKQTVIKSSELPGVIGDDETLSYTIRYRVVSEDKNRFSHWSPIYKLTVQNTFDETGFDPSDPENTNIPHYVEIKNSARTASISWTMPSLLIVDPTEEEKELQAIQAAIKEFDVYVQWETSSVLSEWIWVGTSNGTSYTISFPHGTGAPDRISFRVQKVTTIKEAFDAATYLVSTLTNL